MAARQAGPQARSSQAISRQITKRTLCPFINSKIIEVADTGDARALMARIGEFMPDMNLVNLTTSLHRLAKLCSDSPDARTMIFIQANQDVLNDLLSAIQTKLEKSDTSLNGSRRQALSNIVWSLGTLKIIQEQLVHTTCEIALRELGQFRPFELASTVWAFAKIGVLHPDVRTLTWGLVDRSAVHVNAVMSKLGFRFLIMVAWAFAATERQDPALFEKLAKRILTMLRHAETSPEMLTDIAWAFRGEGPRHRALLDEVARRARSQVTNFTAAELAELCRLASMEESHASWDFIAAAACQTQALAAQPQHLAAVLAAAARGCPSAVQASSVLALLPLCTRGLAGLDNAALASVTLSVAKNCQRLQLLPQGSGSPAVAVEFFAVAATLLPGRLPSLSGQPLAEFAVALTVARVPQPLALQQVLAHQICHKADTFSSTAVTMLLQEFFLARSVLYTATGPSLMLRAVRALSEFSEADLTVVAQLSCAQVGIADPAALSRPEIGILCALLGRAQHSAAQVRHALAALRATEPPPEAKIEAAAQVTSVESLASTSFCSSYQDSDISPASSGLGAVDSRSPSKRSERFEAFDSSSPASGQLMVKNTFFEPVDEASPASEGKKKASSPALDIVRQSVSREELEACRLRFEQWGLV